MKAYWLKFAGHKPGCVEADSEEAAKAIGKEVTGHEPTSAAGLPYPAEPRLNKHSYDKHGACPSFCYSPEKCAGLTSCPQRIGCVE